MAGFICHGDRGNIKTLQYMLLESTSPWLYRTSFSWLRCLTLTNVMYTKTMLYSQSDVYFLEGRITQWLDRFRSRTRMSKTTWKWRVGPMYGYATPFWHHFDIVFDVSILDLNLSINLLFCEEKLFTGLWLAVLGRGQTGGGVWLWNKLL
jgi:hypothetical protein